MARYELETEEQVKDAAAAIERREYWETVKSLAESALAEHPGDEDAQREDIEQSVDGNFYVIYGHGNLIALMHSANDEAWRDVGIDLDPDKAIAQIAYFAMLADVEAELVELREAEAAEAEETEEDETAAS